MVKKIHSEPNGVNCNEIIIENLKTIGFIYVLLTTSY